MADADGSGTLSNQRDVIGVAPEAGDVVPDPLESEELVVEADVARRILRLSRQETYGGKEDPHTVQKRSLSAGRNDGNVQRKRL